MFLEMTDSERLKIQIIDEQHQKMANLINKMHQELGAKFDGESKRLLKQFADATKEHFVTEEKMMQDNNYTGFFSHKLEHDRFYKKVEDFLGQVEKGNETMNLEFLKGLRKWFFNHFELNDKKCGEYLLQKGIQ